MFLVAGGWDGYDSMDSTETLVEGGQEWVSSIVQRLPAERSGPRGISMQDTVLMIGKNFHIFIFTFTFPLFAET